MNSRSRVIVIFTVLFGYVLLQFLWWEILLVRQTGTIINEKQKVAELTIADSSRLSEEVSRLHRKKMTQTVMIVCEGTVFLLLLIYGAFKVRQSHQKEIALGNQQKNFFMSITHELKTPIAATKLQLQTLRRSGLDDMQRKDLIEAALSENERLNSLIDNVLLATRFESGEYTLRKQEADLSQLVQTVAERYFRPEIAAGTVKLEIAGNVRRMIDEQAFTSVITNLIDNALKYSPSKKEILVALNSASGKVKFSVADRGIGVAPSEKTEIFRRFYRAGSEAVRTTKGTGLGLYIVNYIARQHNAVTTVKDNPGGGSVFEVTFNEA